MAHSSHVFLFLSHSYCLTTDDASLDARLTRIQQRCLISERSSNCSTVVTPKAERAQKQSRRMKAAKISHDIAEKNKTEKNGTCEQEATHESSVAIEKKEAPILPVAPKATPKKRRPFHTGRSQYKSGPIKLTKSPVVKISKAHQRHLIHTRGNTIPKTQPISREGEAKPDISEQSITPGLSTNNDLKSVSELKEDTEPSEPPVIKTETETESVNEGIEQGNETSMARLPPLSDTRDTSPVDQPETSGGLRRSPRVNKWRPSARSSKLEPTSLTDQRKEKKLKTVSQC